MAGGKGIRRLTQADMVLIALYRAAEGTTARVPYEELVLRAWRTFPYAFSLRNHPQFPDASDIHKRVYQTLKPGGMVLTLGNKVFRLTEKGLAEAKKLSRAVAAESPAQAPQGLRLARDEEEFVRHALQSRAFNTWTSEGRDELIDYDARVFFQFSTGTPKQERRRKVEFAREAIEHARAIGIDSAVELDGLVEFLLERFGERLIGG